MWWRVVAARRDFGTPAERAAFEALHLASTAAPPLRAGLTAASVARAAPHLHALLASAAITVTDATDLLGWEGVGGDHHGEAALAAAREVLAAGRAKVLQYGALMCPEPDCPIRAGVVVPLVVADTFVGTLGAFGVDVSTALVRATTETARWVSAQLELAELDQSRARAAEAELRALRAQISPHFIYNSLTAIASFVRSDPERARELLLEFADFTRYSFRRHGEFTTLAEELRSIDRYLLLERARFGDRLQITLQVAPEVLPVVVPFLSLQPLVENAVRHGLERKPGVGRITITATDVGSEAVISVEDDGCGIDPEALRRTLDGTSSSDSIGLANVDERLRSVFGPQYGLVVETAVGAGTRVTVRVPKFSAGVRAS